MPEEATLKHARRDKRQGKAPTTQAGEFVREEMHHVREGKHGARSTKQAIAIGLSKARRAGVKLGRPPASAKATTKRSAKYASRAAHRRTRPAARRKAGARHHEKPSHARPHQLRDADRTGRGARQPDVRREQKGRESAAPQRVVRHALDRDGDASLPEPRSWLIAIVLL
jgi:hypothetical protein